MSFSAYLAYQKGCLEKKKVTSRGKRETPVFQTPNSEPKQPELKCEVFRQALFQQIGSWAELLLEAIP